MACKQIQEEISFGNISLLPLIAWLIHNTNLAKKLSILCDDVKILEFPLSSVLLYPFKLANISARYTGFATHSTVLNREAKSESWASKNVRISFLAL